MQNKFAHAIINFAHKNTAFDNIVRFGLPYPPDRNFHRTKISVTEPYYFNPIWKSVLNETESGILRSSSLTDH